MFEKVYLKKSSPVVGLFTAQDYSLSHSIVSRIKFLLSDWFGFQSSNVF